MSKKYKLLMLSVLMLYSISGFAKSIAGLHFSHHDWEIACDNTGTCRAAGYHSDEDDGARLSVLLTRKAGKGAIVKGQLKLATFDDPETIALLQKPSALSMSINGKSLGSLTTRNDEIYALSSKQTKALVKALSGVSTILFAADHKQWLLSDKGGAAVLIKMDEFQKRLGTRGALIRKGNAGEANVLKAQPMPVIKKPNLLAGSKQGKPLDNAQKAALLSVLKPTKTKGEYADECSQLSEDNGDLGSLSVYKLNAQFSLVSATCWMAAYNAGSGFWLMDADLRQVHQFVTESGTDYDDGIIYESHKGRGIGDCRGGMSWAWNGKAFALAENYTTGMCKLIEPGGTWKLLTHVSAIR